MICVSLAEPTAAACLGRPGGVDFAEVRLDQMAVGAARVRRIFSSHPGLVATCRPGGAPAETRRGLLLAAIAAGAAYVDIELEPARRLQELSSPRRAKARAAGSSSLITISRELLREAELEERSSKSALPPGRTSPRSPAARIARQRPAPRAPRHPRPLGGRGHRQARGEDSGRGGPARRAFDYASLGEGRETAEGQIDVAHGSNSSSGRWGQI